MQRLAHYTKSIAPQIFLNVDRIFYGDMKCPLKQFVRFARIKYQDIITLQHPARHQRPLVKEFVATKKWMKKRNESNSVIDDIDKLALLYQSELKSSYIANLPDTMCMAYNVNSQTIDFSKIWSSTIKLTSMQEQLSFNIDLERSRIYSKIDVLYINTGWPGFFDRLFYWLF